MADDRKSPEAQQGEGKAEELKGRAKQAGGAITDNQKTKAEGQADELKGKARQKMGEAREKIRDNI